MNELKAFFRKKSTKIYFVIITVLIIMTILLYSFKQFFHDGINQEYDRTSVYVTYKEKDYFDLLKQEKDIKKIQRALLLFPDYLGDLFKETATESLDEETGLYGINRDYLIWQNFQYYPNEEIIVYPNSYRPNLKLETNEIAISIHNGLDNKFKEYAQTIINKTFKMHDHNNNYYEFKIKDTYESGLYEMIISDELFNEIIKEDGYYVYSLKINSDNNKFDLNQKMQNNNIKYIDNTVNDYELISSYTDLETIFNYLIKGVICIFAIVLIISIRNMTSDEARQLRLLRLIGYNSLQTKALLVIEIISLSIISVISAICLSLIIGVAINTVFNLNIIITNYLLFKNLFLVLIILGILIALLTKIKLKNN